MKKRKALIFTLAFLVAIGATFTFINAGQADEESTEFVSEEAAAPTGQPNNVPGGGFSFDPNSMPSFGQGTGGFSRGGMSGMPSFGQGSSGFSGGGMSGMPSFGQGTGGFSGGGMSGMPSFGQGTGGFSGGGMNGMPSFGQGTGGFGGATSTNPTNNSSTPQPVAPLAE